MSNKKQGRATPASSKKRKQRSVKSRSPVIPVVVGLVVVVLVLGAIISFRNQQSAGRGDATGSVATAQARATQSIPYPGVARISLEETLQKLDQGQAVLVDVRSSLSYETAHAAEASSFPEEEIEARLDELPRDQDLVLY
jgi:flagellar basal body-associated protein FliL